MKKLKYILFILFGIFLFIPGVKAESYPYVATDTRLYYAGTEYKYTSDFPIYVYLNTNNAYFNQVNSSVNMQFEPRLMGGGNYLVDAYIIADPINTLSCADIDTNFHYFDEVSQSWFTSSDEIKSECVDIYQTKFNYNGDSIAAHRILMKFWINSESVDSGTVVKTLKMYVFGNFNIQNNSSKTYFGYSVNSITDYTDEAVNTFANTRQQDQIINQNTTIINQNNTTNEKLEFQIEQEAEAEKTRKGIWETIKNLPSAFLDMLLGLFIPDDMSFVTDFVDALESKLGFIASVPVQIIEFAINLVTASWDTFDSLSFPSISIFGYNFWNAQEVDLTEAINIFKPFKYVTDVICVVLCARTLNKWREAFTGGGSS